MWSSFLATCSKLKKVKKRKEKEKSYKNIAQLKEVKLIHVGSVKNKPFCVSQCSLFAVVTMAIELWCGPRPPGKEDRL